jgi:hypothetical protein
MDLQRLYGGKNRTPYVKDAFNDHVIPSHRPKEPEPERSPSAGLPTKGSRSPVSSLKSPKLPGMTPIDDNDEEDEQDKNLETHTNGNGEEVSTDSNGVEHIIEPPPRPVNQRGARQFVNPDKVGTKAAAHYIFNAVPGKGGCVVVRLKMTPSSTDEDPSILDEELFDDNIEERRVDADEFYGRIARGSISDDLRNVMRQALSGMLWYVSWLYTVIG